MKTMLKLLIVGAVPGLMAGCTQAYYDQQRAAGNTPAAETKPMTPVNQQTVSENATNVANAANTGAGQFGGWMRQHGFNIHTSDNPPTNSPPTNSSGK
jgi:hypothetical protein